MRSQKAAKNQTQYWWLGRWYSIWNVLFKLRMRFELTVHWKRFLLINYFNLSYFPYKFNLCPFENQLASLSGEKWCLSHSPDFLGFRWQLVCPVLGFCNLQQYLFYAFNVWKIGINHSALVETPLINPIQGGPLTEGSAKNYIAALEKYFGYILFGKY